MHKTLNNCEDRLITPDEHSFETCLVILKERNKKRYELLALIISCFKVLILMKSLKLPGYSQFNPVFISFLGLASSWLKIIYIAFQSKKKNIVQIIQSNKGSNENLYSMPHTRSMACIEPKSASVRRKNNVKNNVESTCSQSEITDDIDLFDDRKNSNASKFFKKPKKKKI